MSNKRKALCFDFDDTLVNSTQAILALHYVRTGERVDKIERWDGLDVFPNYVNLIK